MSKRRNSLSRSALLGLALVLGLCQPLVAQFQRGDRGERGGRGGPDGGGGGGFPGGGGFGGGGFPGGGGFGGGGWGGGGFGGGGGFNPADMLKRLDVNNDGTLQPSEMEGRSRFFLERMTRDIPGIDLSQPIALEKLTRDIEQARAARSGGSDTSPGSGGGSGSNNQNNSKNSKTNGKNVPKPLVPGFGVETTLALVPGFGESEGSAPLYVIIDSDRREADDALNRYDKNKDGILDSDEIRDGRWRDDPLMFDINHDGQLTRDELAQRFAKRRTDEEKQRQGQSQSTGRGGPTPGAGSSQGGGASRVAGMIDDAFNRYDKNKNGILEKEEYKEMRIDPSAGDKDGNGQITREELSAFFESSFQQAGWGRGGFGGGGFGGGGFGGQGGGDPNGGGWGRGMGGDRGGEGGRGDPGRSGPSGSNKSSASADSRKSYRVPSAVEKLPKGLPDWFTRNDADADGQVTMAEYAADWSDAKASEFFKMDTNGDGFLSPKECLAAKSGGSLGSGAVSATDGGSRYGRPSRGKESNPSGTGLTESVAKASSKSETSGDAPKEASDDGAAAEGDRAADDSGSSEPVKTEAADKPTATPAANNGPIEPAYMKYAQGVIDKFDTDKSGFLTANEWSEMPKSPEAADADGDKKVTVEEIARWKKMSE